MSTRKRLIGNGRMGCTLARSSSAGKKCVAVDACNRYTLSNVPFSLFFRTRSQAKQRPFMAM